MRRDSSSRSTWMTEASLVAQVDLPPRRARSVRRYGDLLYPARTLVVSLVVWELWTRLANVPDFLLPPPSEVLLVMVGRADELLMHSWVTIQEIVLGFLLALAIGIPLAIVIVT